MSKCEKDAFLLFQTIELLLQDIQIIPVVNWTFEIAYIELPNCDLITHNAC